MLTIYQSQAGHTIQFPGSIKRTREGTASPALSNRHGLGHTLQRVRMFLRHVQDQTKCDGMKPIARVEKAAERIMLIEEELEAAGTASIAGQELATVRAALHQWVDSVVGVVASPGLGRVTLIHDTGRESKIASPDLPFLLSKPVTFEKQP